MKWLRYVVLMLASLAGGLLLLLISLSAVIGFLGNSEAGSRWLFQIAQEHAPGQLEVARIEGRLFGPLDIRDLHFQLDGLDLQLDHFAFDWRPAALAGLVLEVDRLALKGIRLQLPPSPDEIEEEQTAAEPFAGLELPLAIEIRQLLIEDLQLLQPGEDPPLVLNSLQLAAGAGGNQLRIDQIELDGFDAQLGLSGRLELSELLPMQLELRWGYQLPDGPGLRGQGQVRGDLDKLKLTQSLPAPLSASLQADLLNLLDAPSWDAEIQLDQADLGAFAADFPARLSGTLNSRGNPDNIQARAELKLQDEQLGQLHAKLSVGFVDGVARIEQLLLTNPDGVHLSASGTYTPDDAQGSLDADLQWQGLRWPLKGEQIQFSSPEGRASVKGQPDDYRYQLDLAARLPVPAGADKATRILPLKLSAEGKGNLQASDIGSLRLEVLQGVLQAGGKVAWAPRPNWRLALSGQDINPAMLVTELPGKLAVRLDTEGEIQEQDVPRLTLALHALEGVLREYPLKVSGDLALQGEDLSIKSLSVDSGGNLLDVSGDLGKRMDLDWRIDAGKLAALWPGLGGALQGEGALGGTLETPRLQVRLHGKEVEYETNRLSSLDFNADVDLGGAEQIKLDLRAKGLNLNGQQWQALNLQADGSRNAHRIDLDLSGKDVPQASLNLSATLEEDMRWHGQLEDLRLNVPELGDWRLRRPVAFDLGAERQKLAQLCLDSGDAGLCAEGGADRVKGWQARLEAPGFPLGFFQPWLAEAMTLSGAADLKVSFEGGLSGDIHGQAELLLPDGVLDFDLAEEPQKLDFSGGKLYLSLTDKGADARLAIPLAGLGDVRGDIQLPGLSLAELDAGKQALGGRIQAQINDLGLVELVAPQVQNVKGAIQADFQLQGTLARPGLGGEAQLRDAAVDIPEAGLELRQIALQLSAPDLQTLKLQASVQSGGGELKMAGSARLEPEAGFPTDLHIRGENWRAINIPEAELEVSPDLRIKHSKQRTDLDGELRIPFARLRPRDIPAGAVSGSDDLVMVGKDAPEQSSSDMNFHSRLRIIFGDRVSFEGFGLRALLSGDLQVIDEPGHPVIGQGRVGISEGTYRAYGQDLKIERGYALFADSPVDNPGLDVRAVREAGDVTAGLQVSGTLKAPDLSLFSTPSMADGEIMSYLLTGRAPGEGGGNTGVTAALAASGVGSLSSEVGRQLGLDELRVDTGNGLAQASVVAGSWLSPRLYVQYVNEIATRETKLRLRYDLTEKLQIQTETGRSQGVDLFYTFER